MPFPHHRRAPRALPAALALPIVAAPAAQAPPDRELANLRAFPRLYGYARFFHPDGSQLHTIGFLPTVPAQPTVEGLRAGRDEVLERALEIIEEGR